MPERILAALHVSLLTTLWGLCTVYALSTVPIIVSIGHHLSDFVSYLTIDTLHGVVYIFYPVRASRRR